jgi:hypothetical protein
LKGGGNVAIVDFFDHRCDIYHIRRENEKRGYGLPDRGSIVYPDTPDISGQPCHFSVKEGTLSTMQLEPQKELESGLKLTLPAGTDIRINDRVYNSTLGIMYEAETPRDIRGHHTTVWVKRVYPKSV